MGSNAQIILINKLFTRQRNTHPAPVIFCGEQASLTKPQRIMASELSPRNEYRPDAPSQAIHELGETVRNGIVESNVTEREEEVHRHEEELAKMKMKREKLRRKKHRDTLDEYGRREEKILESIDDGNLSEEAGLELIRMMENSQRKYLDNIKHNPAGERNRVEDAEVVDIQ